MNAHDAVQTARAELTSAVAVCQQLLDEHGQHPRIPDQRRVVDRGGPPLAGREQRSSPVPGDH